VVKVSMPPRNVEDGIRGVQLDALVEIEDGCVVVLLVIKGIALPTRSLIYGLSLYIKSHKLLIHLILPYSLQLFTLHLVH
jgi:hypothetical protein